MNNILLMLDILACQPGTYGAGCLQRRVCHCTDENGCNIFSGVCNGICAEGWYGKYCNERKYAVY